MLACKIGLSSALEAERPDIILRLLALLPGTDFLLVQEIDRCLASYLGREAEQ